MDNETVRLIAARYAAEVRKQMKPTPDAVILFGSQVTGEATPDSDIDIAVICKGFCGNPLEASRELWHLTTGIDTRIEPILLDPSKDPSGFAQQVMQKGVHL